MRLPTPTRAETRSSGSGPSNGQEDDRSSGSGFARKVLIAMVLTALAYLVSKRMRSGEPVPWADEESDDAGAPGSPGGTADRESIGETASDGSSDETAAGVDPTVEEVDERVDEDVDDQPTEPGRMSVGEDVAAEADEVESDEGSGETDDDEGTS